MSFRHVSCSDFPHVRHFRATVLLIIMRNGKTVRMLAMSMANAQKRQFQDRIGRISKGGPNTLGQLYCGVSEEAKSKPQKSRGKRKVRFKGAQRSRFGRLMRETIMLPMSLMLGGAVVVMSRVGIYRFLPEGGEFTLKLGAAGEFLNGTFGLIVVASVLLLLFGAIFRTLKGMRAAATCVGFAVLLAGEGAMVERYPDVWATLYSPEYVTDYAAIGLLANF